MLAELDAWLGPSVCTCCQIQLSSVGVLYGPAGGGLAEQSLSATMTLDRELVWFHESAETALLLTRAGPTKWISDRVWDRVPPGRPV